MLPKETAELYEKKKLACFYGNNFEKEFQRLRNRIELNSKDEFIELYKNLTKEIHEQIEMWDKFKNFENIIIPASNSGTKK